MVDSDNANDLIKLSKSEQTYPNHHALITVERTEKLDLLIHLISHLSPSIVICGPKGIGKTTFLNALQEHRPVAWQYCVVPGNPALDLETFQHYIQQQTPAITKKSAYSHHKTVLVIDNAGLLAPGLITSLIEFAVSDAGLDVIFALTPDELYLKNHSDPLIEECHIIEIPPLSEKQCGEFLQYLAARPGGARLSLNERTATAIYHKTHGVPADIVGSLLGLTPTKKQDRALAILIATVIVLVSVTLGIQWFSQTKSFLNRHFTGHHQATP